MVWWIRTDAEKKLEKHIRAVASKVSDYSWQRAKTADNYKKYLDLDMFLNYARVKRDRIKMLKMVDKNYLWCGEDVFNSVK